LERFQAGKLSPADEEWHRLIPEALRETFDKNTIQRQSILFEIIKSERDYVADMQAVNDVRLSLSPLHELAKIPVGLYRKVASRLVHNAFGSS
jgi:hypothetical protein